MKLKIEIASTISAQRTFGSTSPFDNIYLIDSENCDTKTPIYKEFIPPLKIRRLSPLLRMSLTTAIDCLRRNQRDIGAIVIGTGLGCSRDTQAFLQLVKSTAGQLSPSAFIHSTHNTVSGQISLFFKNHGYNITHSQNNLSFELSVLDCINTMIAEDDINYALLGSTDEYIPFLDELKGIIIDDRYPLTEVSTTMIVGEAQGELGEVVIDGVYFDYSQDLIKDVLNKNDVYIDEFDIVLHSGVDHLIDSGENVINYLDFCGINMSASAFACHYAFDLLKKGRGTSAVIVNNLCPESTGIVVLSKNV